MAGRLSRAARVTAAVWYWLWSDPPRLCLRHWLDVARKSYGYHDYGVESCPRCNPPLS